MNKAKSAIRKYWRNRKSHWLFPLVPFSVTVVTGLLQQAEAGAFFLIIAMYSILVIFPPWGKLKLVNKRQTLSRLARFGIPTLACLLIFITSWGSIVHIFSGASIEPRPNLPVIDLIPNPHPTQHLPNVAQVVITAEPAHGYDSYINPRIVISNPDDSPPYCSVTLQLHLTGGFRFYRLEDIPNNFKVKDGYLYSDNMTIDIKDCPSNWVYSEFKIPVYNMDSNTIPGSENQNVSINVTKISFESG